MVTVASVGGMDLRPIKPDKRTEISEALNSFIFCHVLESGIFIHETPQCKICNPKHNFGQNFGDRLNIGTCEQAYIE